MRLPLDLRFAPWTNPDLVPSGKDHHFQARLIWLLGDRTTALGDGQIATLSEIARLFSRSAFLLQRVTCGNIDAHVRAHDTVAAQVCQLDATWRLARVVPAEHAMWCTLGELQLELAESIMVEQAFVCGYRQLRSLDRTTATQLAVAKNSLARLGPHVVAALDSRFDPAPFDEAIGHVCVAVQALRDVTSWEIDAAARRPSLVLAGADPDALLGQQGEKGGLKRLVSGGQLGRAVDLAAEHIILARGFTSDRPDSRLAATLTQLQTRVDAVRELLRP